MAKAKRQTSAEKPAAASVVRDRIKDFRRIRAGDLSANPKNWRTHPKAQIDALQGVLNEIGYADALLARELPDGTLELVDGHARQALDPDQMVPVLILDIDQNEANKLLTVLDPLAAMAEANQEALGQLLLETQTDNAGLQAMLDAMAKDAGLDVSGAGTGGGDSDAGDQPVDDSWSIVVACENEADQQALYERLTAEGRKCRPLTM
jgi:hypothetical protein